MSDSRLVIYTALFGAYDQLQDPKERFENCDFVCFTDQGDLKSEIWKIIYIQPDHESPLLMNRKIKILPHLYVKDWQYSLYVDSNIFLKKNPYYLVDKYLKRSYLKFFVSKHYLRDCIYREAAQCIKLGKGNPSDIQLQLETYQKAGFPIKWGLSENGILLREHGSKNVIKLSEDWWEQFLTYSKRDQLSLPFALWKNGYRYSFLEESCRQYFGIFSLGLHSAENKTLHWTRKIWFKYVYSKRNPISRFLLNR